MSQKRVNSKKKAKKILEKGVFLMPSSRPKFTEAEVRRLQERVNRNKAKKTGVKESSGLYDRVDDLEAKLSKLEKKSREHETRLDNAMIRIHRLEQLQVK